MNHQLFTMRWRRDLRWTGRERFRFNVILMETFVTDQRTDWNLGNKSSILAGHTRRALLYH